MDLMPTNKALELVAPEDLVDYLQLNGWKETQNTRRGWRVFLGDASDDGDPFEVVIPQKRSPEGDRFLASSVNLLSELTEEPPELVLQRIQNRNQDVLQIYEATAENSTGIALESAAKQVVSMKKLVGFGALSEKSALPHYQRLEVSATGKILRKYQFGHTLRGSFGFTINSPLGEAPSHLRQLRMFDENDSLDIEIAPLERRVMERIVRGLQITVEETRSHRPENIASYYASGFNANMCTSIVTMSDNKDIPLEYRVLWSPRLAPSQDLTVTPRIRTERLEYASLETAALILKDTAPARVTIRGRVTALSSSEKPLSGEARRNVIISWINKDRRGPTKVLAQIDVPEDYHQALRWHEDWDIIEVSGHLQRYGNYWRLNDASGFTVV